MRDGRVALVEAIDKMVPELFDPRIRRKGV